MAAEAATLKRDERSPWLRTHFINRLGELDRERSSYVPVWRDTIRYIAPSRGALLWASPEGNRGQRRDYSIIDNTALDGSRTMASGMMGGISSPARPWFRLRLRDERANTDGEVKAWLDEVQRRMLYIFAKSNLYNCLHTLYGELGDFGTAALWIDEDEEDIVRGYALTAGEYWLASSNRLAVDTIYRSMWWTVRQIVQTFGRDAVSMAIRTAFDRGELNGCYEILHILEPNPNAAPANARPSGKGFYPWAGSLASRFPFRSVWLERGASGENLLRVSGYEEFPCMAPRWSVVGTATYGTDCPGRVALGDTKQLQQLQKRSSELFDKSSLPPMVAGPNMKNEPMSQLPGGVTFDSSPQGQGFRVAYEINPQAMNYGEVKIAKTQERIRRAYYADLWMMMTESDRREITAREVDERHEEKMLMLGPVLERLHDELLDPLVTRVFNIMVRNGLIPPASQAIRSQSLQVEFISMLALAQKALTTGPIERLWQFGSQMAAVKPEALDRLDADGTIDQYADMIGAPASVLVDRKKADAMRQARAQQQAQAMAVQQMGEVAKAAQVTSGIDVGGGRNAVEALMGGGA